MAIHKNDMEKLELEYAKLPKCNFIFVLFYLQEGQAENGKNCLHIQIVTNKTMTIVSIKLE